MELKSKNKFSPLNWPFILKALALSLFLHFCFYTNLNFLVDGIRRTQTPKLDQSVKVTIVPKKAKDKDTPDNADQKIAEVRQEETERPDNAKFKSFEDHVAEKETRTDHFNQKKAADAGSTSKKSLHQKTQKNAQSAPSKARLEIGPGDLEIAAKEKKQELYKSIMPSQQELTELIKEGYQDYLDDSIELGDRIDINTTQYRYMGYFTNMRKSIELVWNYPVDAARRGMQGEVGVEFVIHKEGHISRVRITKSSGYKILDDALIEALELAAPFAPLPEDFGERKLITGSFRYILSSYFAGAR